MNTESPPNSNGAHYSDYLRVNDLLSLQVPLSSPAPSMPPAAHDEMLFIIDHQAYELWFKQILFETESCIKILRAERIDDDGPELQLLVNRLSRVVVIWKVLHLQIDVLETMTPMDFLEFRHLFTGASGFQSTQFRRIEILMGLKPENRHCGGYYKKTEYGGLKAEEVTSLSNLEAESNVCSLVTSWLSRNPALKLDKWKDFQTKHDSPFTQHPFWREYRSRYETSLSKDDKKTDRMAEFDHVLLTCGTGGFSADSLRSALFIMLYRDLPMFRLPYQLLKALIEIDEQMGEWRHRHLQMVRRMIGLRTGTGGSSGAGYLQGTLAKSYAFGPLNDLTTFMVRRTSSGERLDGLPELPKLLRQSLEFRGV